MNNSVTLVLIFVLLISIYAGNSYGAKMAPREDPSLPVIHLQLVLRNSEGQLVSYVETDFVYIRNLYLTHEFLDSIDNKSTVIRDGKTYEQIQFQKTEYFNSVGQKTAYQLFYKNMAVLLLMHDAYIASPGDELTISWKIVRTLP